MSAIQRNTRSRPLKRDDFHSLLREWCKQQVKLADDPENIDAQMRIDGKPPDTHGQSAWMWVKSPIGTFHFLNGDTQLWAVAEYLKRVKDNPKLEWTKGNETKDAFRVDPGGEYLEWFQFYRPKKQS